MARKPAPSAAPSRMADVADRAGVSAITVSRALRTPDKVSPRARARIDAAIRALGYVPNLAAGTLKSQRSRIVAAIVPTLANSIFAETVEGMTDVLREHGYQLLLGNAGYSPETEEALVAAFLGRQPDGLILTGVQHTRRVRAQLRDARMPVVETWELTDAPIDLLVGFSNFEAARRMTLALIARGYRNIAFAGVDPASEPRSGRRQAGYCSAIEAQGRTPIIFTVAHEAGQTIHNGARAMAQMLQDRPEVDAVFFANDFLALGALMECARRKLAVPGRIAIAGFGDFEVAREVIPSLTTVRIPGRDIGRRAAAMLVERLAGQKTEMRLDLGFEIVLRDSA
jgi:LacI family transcriptional regulator, gluconate utilization system Gnt-I transcriptional repressor